MSPLSRFVTEIGPVYSLSYSFYPPILFELPVYYPQLVVRKKAAKTCGERKVVGSRRIGITWIVKRLNENRSISSL